MITNDDDLSDVIGTVEAAALLGVSRPRVSVLIRTGRLTAVRYGHDLYVKRADVLAHQRGVSGRVVGSKNSYKRVTPKQIPSQ